MKSIALFILFFITLNVFEKTSDQCVDAPIGEISATKLNIPIQINGKWSTMTESGINNSCPELEQNPNAIYEGKDSWIQFNSSDYRYLAAAASNGKKIFNLYTSCDPASIVSTMLFEGIEVYELNPNTTYLVQILKLSEKVGSQFISISDQFNLVFQEDIPQTECSNAFNLSVSASATGNLIEFPSIPGQLIHMSPVYLSFTPSESGSIKLHPDDKLYSGTCQGLYSINNEGEGHHFVETGQSYFIEYLPTNRITAELLFYSARTNETCDDASLIQLDVNNNNNQLLYRTEDAALPHSGYFIFNGSGETAVKITNGRLFSKTCANSAEILTNAENIAYGLVASSNYILVTSGNESSNNFRVEAANAPTSNNRFNTRIQISEDGTIHTPDFTYTSNSGFGVNPTDRTLGDVWYQINNTNERISIQNLTLDQDYSIHIFVDDGASGKELIHELDINSQGTFAIPFLPIGPTYYMQVTSNLTTVLSTINTQKITSIVPDQSIAFALTPTNVSGTGPGNDSCFGAISFSDRNNLSAEALANATPHASSIPVCNDPADYYQPSVWFIDEATAGGVFSVTNNVTVYTGGCNALEVLDCPLENNDTDRRIQLIEGLEYRFAVTNLDDDTRINITRRPTESNCPDREVLPIAGTTTSFPDIDAGIYNPYDPIQCNDGSILRRDAWLKFTAPANFDLLSINSNAGKNSISLYTGDCNSLVEDQCQILNSGESLSWNLTPGTEYILRIAGTPSLNDLTYFFSFFPEEDDECATASAITISEDPLVIDRSQAYSHSTPGATCDPNSLSDLWKSFTAPATGTVIIETTQTINADNPYLVELYSDCNTPVSGSCSSNSKTIYDGLTTGQTYYFRMNTEKGNERNTVIYSPATATGNDSCNDALAVNPKGCGSPFTGQSYNMQNGSWYSTIVPAFGGIALTTNGVFTASIYYKDCSNLVLYDSISTSGDLLVQGLPAGEVIFINIKENSNYSFCLTVIDDIIHDNTQCEFSETLSNIDVLECTNPNSISLIPPHNRGEDLDLWYKFTATSNAIDFSITNIADRYANILFIEILDACDGEKIAPVTRSLTSGLTNLTIGQEYFIHIITELNSREVSLACINSPDYSICFTETANSSQLDFDICLVELPPPAANDLCAQATVLTLSPDCSTVIQDSTHSAYDDKFDCFAGSQELWYSYTPSDNINFKINVFNATSPMNIAIFENGCNGRAITCTKDSAIIVAQSGTEYSVAISKDLGAANTSYDLCLSELVIEGSTDNVGIDVSDPVVKLQVAGAMTLGMDDVPIPGAVRFTGQDFQGFTSSGWQSLSSGNASGNSNLAGDNLGNSIAEQNLNMLGFQIENLNLPSESHHAANKAYVDQALASFNASAIDSSANSSGDNLFLERLNENGINYILNLESGNTTISADMNQLNNGWDYENGSGQSFDTYAFADFNVGIGVEEPAMQFMVDGDSRFGNSSNFIDIYNDSGNGFINVNDGQNLILSNQTQLQGGGSFIFDTGNFRLGIGEPSPSANIHVKQQFSSTNLLHLERSSTTPLIVKGNGDIGIGTDNPEVELDVHGTLQVKKNSSSGDPHLNIVEDGSDFIRLYMENSTGNRAVIAARPETNTDDSKMNFFLDGAGDVMTIRGNDAVGVNNTNPTFPLHIGTNTSNGNGAHVTTGGTWTNGSSRTFKDNFQAVNPADILTKLAGLNVLQWNYIGSDEGMHLGPIAEEFHAAFGLGNNEKYIATVDADGVALAAIKALYDQNQELLKTQKEHAEQLAQQEKEMKNLKKQLAAVLEQLEKNNK